MAVDDLNQFKLPNSDESVTLTQQEYQYIKATLMELEDQVTRLMSQPLAFATVVEAKNEFNLKAYEKGDRVLIIDRKVRKAGGKNKIWGKIASDGVDKNGWLIVEYPMGGRDRLNIGLNDEVPQCKLIGKDDGNNVQIAFQGQVYEVHGLPGRKFYAGNQVKVDMESRQIHDAAEKSAAGDVAVVKSIVDETHVEVQAQNGQSRVVISLPEMKLETTDRVMLDNSSTVVLRKLAKETDDRFKVEPSSVTWEDIAGLEEAKEELIEALEAPYREKESHVYKFYNMKPPKGILVYGPPGCGKTMVAKAAANSLARTHGVENFKTGFLSVKGPELLSKWVGQAEAGVRELFERGRRHYEEHGYPALIFVDEADAILPVRGSGKSSDVENTIVPMFLAEMDGLKESKVIVMLATNQPRRLDPAVVREDRVDKHIKINRPTVRSTPDYLKIHLSDLPLAKGHDYDEVVAITTGELFANHRTLYKVSHGSETDVFRLGNAVSGAMIKAVCSTAKSFAFRRDREAKKGHGVKVEDFQAAVQKIYLQHTDLNASFDLEDFCDDRGYNPKQTQVEKLHAAKA